MDAVPSRQIPRCALGRYFGNSAQFWPDLQGQYEIAVVEREKGAELAKRVRPADAA
jgi:plasmid maintenance system antidote protein VapI